jgi:hypothetical protein
VVFQAKPYKTAFLAEVVRKLEVSKQLLLNQQRRFGNIGCGISVATLFDVYLTVFSQGLCLGLL